MKVLVVDDSSVMRRIHQRSLEALGWQVTLAEDGVDALKKMDNVPAFDLLLTDLHMPNMDGIELARKVRAKADLAKIKILLVTSDGVMEVMANAVAAGIDDVLIKPFSADAFSDKLRRLTGG